MRFQKCQDCQHIRWPPSIICPLCYSHDTEWIVASGKGKIYTFVVYHQAFHQAFENDLPYVTALIELEEGPALENRDNDTRRSSELSKSDTQVSDDHVAWK